MFPEVIILVLLILLLIAGCFLLDTRQEMIERQNDISATIYWGKNIYYPEVTIRKVRFLKRAEKEIILENGEILTIGENEATIQGGKKNRVPISSGKITIEEIAYDTHHGKVGELRKTVNLSPGDQIQVQQDNIYIMTNEGNERIRRIVYARAEGEYTTRFAPEY